MSKSDWKKTGKSMGGAFSSLGKNIVRSAKTTVDKATDWAEDEENKSPDKNVFNDGSWRNTGKDLGGAFKDFGKAVKNTVAGDDQKVEKQPKDGSRPEDSENVTVESVETSDDEDRQ